MNIIEFSWILIDYGFYGNQRDTGLAISENACIGDYYQQWVHNSSEIFSYAAELLPSSNHNQRLSNQTIPEINVPKACTQSP